MSDDAPLTRWSLVREFRQHALVLWHVRLSIRELRKKNALLRNGLEEVMAAPGRYPNVKPETWARLAAAADLMSVHKIPAVEKQFRDVVISAVRMTPRIILLRPTKSSGPPPAANFLLDRLLIKADRDVILGDMEEEFGTKLAKDGPTRARWWFWRETLGTIVQRNPVCRSILVTGLMRLIEWIFRQIGS